MAKIDIESLKYPIGKFEKPKTISESDIKNWIADIESFPAQIRLAIQDLYNPQLDTPYRPGGWTIRQVVHHCADSHMNSFVRFKLALTEENPTIKPYWEDRWAELADGKTMPVEPSIQLLESLHTRWVVLLKSLAETDFAKTFVHPEHGKAVTLAENTGTYAWHCKHHLAHITELKKREKWN